MLTSPLVRTLCPIIRPAFLSMQYLPVFAYNFVSAFFLILLNSQTLLCHGELFFFMTTGLSGAYEEWLISWNFRGLCFY